VLQWRVLRFCAPILLFLCACSPSDSPSEGTTADDAVRASRPASDARPAASRSEAPDPIERVTGAHTRIVWIQDMADGTDIAGSRRRIRLMGYDSRDGLGERPLLDEQSSYTKPLFLASGNRVVFSNRREGTVHVVNWDGTGLTRLGDGFALDTWTNPDTGAEWVYVGYDESEEPVTYGRVARHRIDRWQRSELVWDKLRVSGDTFQVSEDGRLAGGLFPWPAAGVAELPNGELHRLGRGCWTALAGGHDPLFWIFDGAHRNLTIVPSADREQRWEVRINSAPAIESYEVYHPRWANHPRFLAITGPYTVGTEANKIRGGGEQVEIHLGRFAEDFSAVERWVQVSHNERADFYPDVWIDPSELPSDVMSTSAPHRPARRAAAPEQDRLVVEARLVGVAALPTPESIAPYRQALLVHEYEIVRVLEGSYDKNRILAAHWVIRDGTVLESAAREQGGVYRMTLEPYDEHEELEGERLVMDSDAFDLRLYYDLES